MRSLHTVIGILGMAVLLQGCATAVAIVDVTGAAVIYTGKTIVNTVDAITPDIVNKD
jgi:threonine/homoserine/homoserine lactone efflux protein